VRGTRVADGATFVGGDTYRTGNNWNRGYRYGRRGTAVAVGLGSDYGYGDQGYYDSYAYDAGPGYGYYDDGGWYGSNAAVTVGFGGNGCTCNRGGWW
jgi:hypothetical protein